MDDASQQSAQADDDGRGGYGGVQSEEGVEGGAVAGMGQAESAQVEVSAGSNAGREARKALRELIASLARAHDCR